MSSELVLKIHPECPWTEQQVRNFLDRLQPQDDGCYYWLGARCGDYGRVGLNNKCFACHRVAWIITNGPIPKGQIVRHKCDTPICCNWDHLCLGTYKDNAQDIWDRNRGNPPRGERQHFARLTLQQVSEIKTAINDGTATQCELAKRYGVNKNTINAIRLEYSWRDVEPRIVQVIPTPHRKLSDFDHLDIRDKWRAGASLKTLSGEYGVRVDTIQKIINGKRGVLAPVGERVPSRQNKHKHTTAVRMEMLARYQRGETQISLAREYGMSKNGINLMLHRLSA